MSDDHDEHLKAHIAAGRQGGRLSRSGTYAAFIYSQRIRMTEEQWNNTNNISEADALAYPNARTAYELQQSPLAKALA